MPTCLRPALCNLASPTCLFPSPFVICVLEVGDGAGFFMHFLMPLRQHVLDADFRWGGQLLWLKDSWHDGVDLEQPLVEELEVGHDEGGAIPCGPIDRGHWTCSNQNH